MAAALAMPHHSSTHQHDAAEAKPVAADTQVKPQEAEKPAETKPEENKPEAEAVKPEAAKPEDVKAEASSDSVRKEEHKETPVVPVEHAVEHHAAPAAAPAAATVAEPKPVRSWALHPPPLTLTLSSHPP